MLQTSVGRGPRDREEGERTGEASLAKLVGFV